MVGKGVILVLYDSPSYYFGIIIIIIIIITVVFEPGLQDRLDGIATILPAGRTGVRISAGVRDLFLRKTPRQAVGLC